jgi:hypothetical protein
MYIAIQTTNKASKRPYLFYERFKWKGRYNTFKTRRIKVFKPNMHK